MTDLGKLLVLVGGLVVLIGLLLVLAGRANLPIGRLPGDIFYKGKNATFYFPIGTSILLSVILSAIMYFVGRSRH